jgi:RNA polymerase sigma-70 factor (ECF subfamily)
VDGMAAVAIPTADHVPLRAVPAENRSEGVAVATDTWSGRGRAEDADLPIDFDEFYAAHFHSVAVQLYAYAGDIGEAQDLAQEAFCRAWQRWSKVSRYEDPVGWVRRVAWNLATSRWRRARTALHFTRKHREEHTPAISEDRVALVNALRTLPERQRQALVLHYLADLSVAEIAENTGAAEGTVKSWLHRGRAALAEHFAEGAASHA